MVLRLDLTENRWFCAGVVHAADCGRELCSRPASLGRAYARAGAQLLRNYTWRGYGSRRFVCSARWPRALSLGLLNVSGPRLASGPLPRDRPAVPPLLRAQGSGPLPGFDTQNSGRLLWGRYVASILEPDPKGPPAQFILGNSLSKTLNKNITVNYPRACGARKHVHNAIAFSRVLKRRAHVH